MGLELVEPRLQCDHRLRPEAKHPNPGVVPRSLVCDHPRLQKHPQMPADRGWGGGYRVCQFTRSPGATPQELDDLTSRRVGERFEYGRNLGVEIRCHRDNS